jgi:hypothetical protein
METHQKMGLKPILFSMALSFSGIQTVDLSPEYDRLPGRLAMMMLSKILISSSITLFLFSIRRR